MRKNLCVLSNRTALIVWMVGCVVGFGGVAHSTWAADAGDASRQARRLLARADMNRGVCAVLGSADVALELATASEMLVHVRDPDARVVADVARRAAEAGLGIQRLAAETGALDALPYADNMIDLVVTTLPSGDGQGSISLDEIRRVLRPDGIAMLRIRASAGPNVIDRLRRWAQSNAVERFTVWEEGGQTVALFHKPVPAGRDEWSHWEHGPDNNPVSSDQGIQAPYMTQFLATPYYIGMPSITTAAGGRTFLAIGHIAHHKREWDLLYTLIARNGYNGAVLWQHKLPEGYLVHRSAFVATKDTFYMIDGDTCLRLDPKTGEEMGRIRIAGLEGEWKWMVIQDGVLYALAGKPAPGTKVIKGDRTFGGWSWADLSEGYYTKPHIPFGFGDTLAAYDLAKAQVLWTHKEETLIDSRGMALSNGKMYLYCPDRHLRALASDTGKVLWTNGDESVLGLIEQPGRKLTSTPGFRTACITVATPDALIIQGQTRMNVVAVSTADGYLLWSKKKITNNPNAIYVDGKVVLGVGPGGSHVVIDPVSGEVQEDLKFRKVSCTRLTASLDSFFCRGEGTLRFDRKTKRLLIDGAVRPACNDGAIPANGLLYIGAWQCDCNLSLIGHVARCSAGDFRFDRVATDAERLESYGDGGKSLTPFSVTASDWPTYRSNNDRSANSTVRAPATIERRWEYTPDLAHVPTAPTAAGGLVFVSGDDGVVRAIDAKSGALRWSLATPSAIKYPPTLSDGRAYVGGGDGHVYALEAATGRVLWRFRAAPVERHIMVYGAMGSTWPVQSGVLVKDGIAYCAAGIIDQDGTYVYALDAETGKIKWQNNSSGHLNEELRKGVSVQGNLTIQGDRLLLAGGNQVSPAPFDLATGKSLASTFKQGRPKANNGRFVGLFLGESALVGGRVLYAAAENVSTKGSFQVFSKGNAYQLSFGGIPPAWNDQIVALVNFKHGRLTAFDADKVSARIAQGYGGARRRGDRNWLRNLAQTLESDGAIRWKSDLGETNKFEAISLAVCPNAIVAVVRYQRKMRSQTQWFVAGFDIENGTPLWQQELRFEPLPDGLLVDREGQIVVTSLDGRVACFGSRG